MRKSICAIVLSASSLVLVAARCSDDDASSDASSADAVPADSAVEGKEGGMPEGADSMANPEAGKESDDLFKDPLDTSEGAGTIDEMGEVPPAGEESFLEEPGSELEAPAAEEP